MQSRTQDYYQSFVKAVAKGRNVSIDTVRNGMGQGRVLGSDAALQEKMVDGVMTFDEVVIPSHQPPGTLKRAIIVKQIPEKSGPTQQTFFVTVRKGKKLQGQGKKGNKSQDAYYASWVEFGHWMNTTGKALSGGRSRDAKRAAAIAAGHNKFVPAYPFMRPAYEAKKFDAVSAIKAYLEKRIPVEVEKARR